MAPGGATEERLELGRILRAVRFEDADGKVLDDHSFCFGWGDPPGQHRIRSTNSQGIWRPWLPPGPVTIWPLGSRPDFGFVIDWTAGDDPVVVTMGGR